MPGSSLLSIVNELENGFKATLSGMDYCARWKSSPNEWSAMDVLYHLLDTPHGGLATSVGQVLDGKSSEISISWGDIGVAAEKQSKDLAPVTELLLERLSQMGHLLQSTSDEVLAKTAVTVRFLNRDRVEQVTLLAFLNRYFVNHWRSHLAQVQTIKDILGI
jgi:hypothetical protein